MKRTYQFRLLIVDDNDDGPETMANNIIRILKQEFDYVITHASAAEITLEVKIN